MYVIINRLSPSSNTKCDAELGFIFPIPNVRGRSPPVNPSAPLSPPVRGRTHRIRIELRTFTWITQLRAHLLRDYQWAKPTPFHRRGRLIMHVNVKQEMTRHILQSHNSVGVPASARPVVPSSTWPTLYGEFNVASRSTHFPNNEKTRSNKQSKHVLESVQCIPSMIAWVHMCHPKLPVTPPYAFPAIWLPSAPTATR